MVLLSREHLELIRQRGVQGMSGKAKCWLCGEEVDFEADWCFGCRHHICEEHPIEIWGNHQAEAHNEEKEEKV